MAKKNWIFVKRGLSEDPKHRQAMGDAIWLFMHICDAADWEKGIVYDWRDKEIAVDMSLSTATVRAWRDRLCKAGYITCPQHQHGIEIIIHNWTNPRDYGGKKMNLIQGDTAISPSPKEETPDMGEGVPQGVPQGDRQVLDDPACESASFIESSSLSSSSSSSESTTGGKTENVFTVYQNNIGLLTPMIADALKDAEDTYGPVWVCAAIQEAVKSEARNLKYVEAILKRWKRDGFKSARSDGKKQSSGESVEEYNKRVVKESVYGKS